MLAQAFYKVFRNPKYTTLALASGFVVFALAAWLPNLSLIGTVVSGDASLGQKLALSVSLLGSIATNFSFLSVSYTIAIAVLFGINVAMIAFFLNHRIAEITQSGIATGFLGVASGILGTGCAACGSFILMSGLSLVGASGVLTLLPLGGKEFGLLGVVLLAISIYLTAKRIQNPLVCNVSP